MIEFACGVAVGAAFAPFWITVYNYSKTVIKSYLDGKK